MNPLIGITTYGQTEDGSFTLPREYVDSVRRAGGIPVLICPGEENTSELLDRLDGLILAGGGDIDPSVYGGSEHETVYMTDAERDGGELALAREVIGRGTPTFGICRGMQIINVALGGTLYEHLPDTFGESVNHRLPPRVPTPHAVSVDADTRLAELTVEREFECMSWHHQSLRKAGDGLLITAHAPDGVVEAVELPSHPWLVAVQWHPELTAASAPTQQGLFDAFVLACQ